MVDLKRDMNVQLARQRREIEEMINDADKKGQTSPRL